MPDLALYRKYRSQTFGDLVGQDHVVRTIQNAIGRGRIAHAYLFTGPRGTGKTSTARLLAKALNCQSADSPVSEPCNVCETCLSIMNGNSLDVHELDAASESGVDKVRESIIEAVDYRPAVGRYRVFIIDEVHDLSTKAFDALLKTIEEPPSHVVFVLATTEYSKVPPTIRSRCQRHEFHRGTVQDLVKRLETVAKAEGIEAETAALGAIARMADGGYRDALTLLEQAMVTSDGPVTLQHVYDQLGLVPDETVDNLLRSIAGADVPQIITMLDSLYRLGRDPRALLESLLLRLGDLTLAAYGIEGTHVDATISAAMTSTARTIGVERLGHYRSELAVAHAKIREVTIPKVWLEAEIIRLTREPAAAQPVNPAPPAAAERKVERAKMREPEPPREPEKKREAKKESPPAAAVVREAGPPLVVNEPTGIETVWRRVVADVSELSRTARERLMATRVCGQDAKTVTIEFTRQVDADGVRGNSKLMPALLEAWQRHGGGDFALEFVSAPKTQEPSRPHVEKTAVESILEGDSLVEATREILGGETYQQK
ncbi:MAG: DNA polymerase III subunit gamma/tau [Fimbriimonadaceae bacterium]|nr:DNA polymerase III subunit gamma/tau [Fimbriimonadaceae bacterium]QYK54682.1 MAG: DNA polymerase III subunit gamma/tau [Fimbriimonadaceae bacterium]